MQTLINYLQTARYAWKFVALFVNKEYKVIFSHQQTITLIASE